MASLNRSRRGRRPRNDDEELPCVVPFCICLLALGFIGFGCTYIVAAARGKREKQMSVYEDAIDKWDQLRPTFASITVKMLGELDSSTEKGKSASITLHADTSPDPVYDDQGGAELPKYDPLKYNVTEGTITEAFLHPYNFSAAPAVRLTYSIATPWKTGKGKSPAMSSLALEDIPLTRVRRIPAPQPVPSQKCRYMPGGVYDPASGTCWLYERLKSVCVQVHLQDDGVTWALASAPEKKPGAAGDGASGSGSEQGAAGSSSSSASGSGSGSGSGGSGSSSGSKARYGCDPRNHWRPAAFVPVAVEGFDTTDVTVSEVEFYDLEVQLRSELDPFLHVEKVTNSTLTFGLSARGCLAVGIAFLVVGLLTTTPALLAVRRACASGGGFWGAGSDRAAVTYDELGREHDEFSDYDFSSQHEAENGEDDEFVSPEFTPARGGRGRRGWGSSVAQGRADRADAPGSPTGVQLTTGAG